MTEQDKIEFANATPEAMDEEEIAAAIPVRQGKRRNCMVIPGTSDPIVAKLFCDSLMKEVFGTKQEKDE